MIFFLVKGVLLKANIFLLLLNCIIGFTFIFVLWFIFKGKIGLGDAKLSALLALVLDLNGWIIALFIASSTGLIYGVIWIKLRKKSRKEKIPFGPFLALGGISALLLQILLGAYVIFK